MKTLKQKLRDCAQIAAMHISLTDPCVCELCASLGFDFLWIDTEHTAIDYHTLETHLMAARSGGTESVVRIPWNDPILAKRVLEMGPGGIIFPVINSAEELDRAMKSTLYPPLGTRGFGPMRAIRYGLDDADDYIQKGSLDLVRCVQIESATAVKNLPEMVKNPYVDCFIFGPCDLSGSIGELNRVFEPHTSELMKEAIKIVTGAGKSMGVSTGSDEPEVIQCWHDMGVNVISAGTDYLHVLSGSRKVLSAIRKAQK